MSLLEEMMRRAIKLIVCISDGCSLSKWNYWLNALLMECAVGCLVQDASVSRNGFGRVVRVVFGMLLGPERTRVVACLSLG